MAGNLSAEQLLLALQGAFPGVEWMPGYTDDVRRHDLGVLPAARGRVGGGVMELWVTSVPTINGGDVMLYVRAYIGSWWDVVHEGSVLWEGAQGGWCWSGAKIRADIQEALQRREEKARAASVAWGAER